LLNGAHIFRFSLDLMMIDENLARLRAHRQNIDRYRRLLRGSLTDLERDFIERRMTEEGTALSQIAGETFPIFLTRPGMPTSEAAYGLLTVPADDA
jgi:hypothetical protein